MRHPRLLLTLALILAAFAIPSLLFYIRPPVLVVTDAPFAALYGAAHLKRQQRGASLALFRRVKLVMIADGASPDMVIVAITEASKEAFCVLFPRSQAQAALRFHEQFSEVPAVVLSGLVQVREIPSPDGLLCVYATDRETDLYRAGLFAGILGDTYHEASALRQKTDKQAQKGEKTDKQDEEEDESAPDSQNSAPKTYVLWQDRQVRPAGRELFSTGVHEHDPESAIIFANSFAEIPNMKEIACVVLTGAGVEFLEKKPQMPLILFSWMDPALASQELVVLFDDSVVALIVPAVTLAMQQQAEGKIPSKPMIFSGKIADNGIFRALKKSAKKVPLKDA